MSCTDETLNIYTLPKDEEKKYINHVTHLLNSADFSAFSPEISKFCYIKKYSESLKIVLVNMVTTFMMSPKMSTLGLLKTTAF